MSQITDDDKKFMKQAFELAVISYRQGGIPVGAVLAIGGNRLSRGFNRRNQKKTRILHGEMDCLHRYHLKPLEKNATLYTTLNPCLMCAGTIVQFNIGRVVFGKKEVLFPPDKEFYGNIEFLEQNRIDVLNYADEEYQEFGAYEMLFQKFLDERPQDWLADIGIDE